MTALPDLRPPRHQTTDPAPVRLEAPRGYVRPSEAGRTLLEVLKAIADREGVR